MAIGLKEVLLGVNGGISYFVANLLPPHPGVDPIVKAVGIVACIGGGIIGIRDAKLEGWRLTGLVIAAVVIVGLGIVGFYQIATGPPGRIAAFMLYALSVVIFLPLGILFELIGLSVFGGRKNTD